ncbi:MAG TPA: hypothetical protein VIM48_05085 [Chthoniobacterales bacterium]
MSFDLSQFEWDPRRGIREAAAVGILLFVVYRLIRRWLGKRR